MTTTKSTRDGNFLCTRPSRVVLKLVRKQSIGGEELELSIDGLAVIAD